MTVVGVYQFAALLIAHAFLGQQVAVNVDGMPLADVEHQHVVLAHVEGVLHDGCRLLDLVGTFSDAQQGDAVQGPGDDERDDGDEDHDHRREIERHGCQYLGV